MSIQMQKNRVFPSALCCLVGGLALGACDVEAGPLVREQSCPPGMTAEQAFTMECTVFEDDGGVCEAMAAPTPPTPPSTYPGTTPRDRSFPRVPAGSGPAEPFECYGVCGPSRASERRASIHGEGRTQHGCGPLVVDQSTSTGARVGAVTSRGSRSRSAPRKRR